MINWDNVNKAIKNIIELAVPIFIANLSIVLTGTIDTFMVGHISAAALAGVSIGTTVVSWIGVSFVGIIQGLSPVAGYLYGGKRYKEIGDSLVQSLYIASVISAIAFILTIDKDIWLSITGLEGSSGNIAGEYIKLASFSLPAIIFSRCFISIFAAVSLPKITMIITIIQLLLKIPLNNIFITGLYFIPAFGGAGAGLATSVLSWIALGGYVSFWFIYPSFRKMREHISWKISYKKQFNLLKIGMPIGLGSFFEMSSYTLMAIFISYFGIVALSAHQIVANLVWLYYVFPLAIGVAGSVVVAQRLGGKDKEKAKYAALCSVVLSVGNSFLIALFTWLCSYQIASFYTSVPEIIKMVQAFLIWVPFYHIMDSIQCCSSNVLRGYRVTFLPMAVSSFLLCGVGIVLGCVLSGFYPLVNITLGAVGFWIAADIALLLTAVVLFVVLLYQVNKTHIF